MVVRRVDSNQKPIRFFDLSNPATFVQFCERGDGLEALAGLQFFELSKPSVFAKLMERAKLKTALRGRGGVAIQRSTTKETRPSRGVR